jgi:hypothetical protein
MTGFNNDGILKWDDTISKCVGFHLKYISIILDDVKRGIICCVTVDAGDLFSKVDYGIRKENIVYKDIFVVEYPPGQNSSRFSPQDAYRYVAIEKHQISKRARVQGPSATSGSLH